MLGRRRRRQRSDAARIPVRVPCVDGRLLRPADLRVDQHPDGIEAGERAYQAAQRAKREEERQLEERMWREMHEHERERRLAAKAEAWKRGEPITPTPAGPVYVAERPVAHIDPFYTARTYGASGGCATAGVPIMPGRFYAAASETIVPPQPVTLDPGDRQY